jgi:hypothetical protein
LDQNVQNIAILINCSPQILNAAIYLEEHSIMMPLVPRPRRFSPQVVSMNLTKLEAAFSDRLVAESDTAHRQLKHKMPTIPTQRTILHQMFLSHSPQASAWRYAILNNRKLFQLLVLTLC